MRGYQASNTETTAKDFMTGLLKGVVSQCRKAIQDKEFSMLPLKQQIQLLADLAALQSHTGQEGLYETLDALTSGSRALSSNHYGVRDGKGRLLALYKQLYGGTGDEKYLREAIRIGGEQVSNKFIRHRAVGDYSLYRGQAGRILNLLALPGENIDTANSAPITSMIEDLLGSAWLGTEGILWPPATDERQGSISLAYGTSGIAYVLCSALESDGCREILPQIFAYEDSVYDEETSTWPDYRNLTTEEGYGNYGFETGASGIVWVRLQAYKLLGDDELLIKPLEVARQITQILASEGPAHSLSFASGLTGYGYFFKELYLCTGDKQWHAMAEKVADYLIRRLGRDTALTDANRLRHHMEAATFLADFQQHEENHTNISPVPHIRLGASGADKPSGRIASFGSGQLADVWLQKEFKVTVDLLKAHSPEVYQDCLLWTGEISLFKRLEKSVTQLLTDQADTAELHHQFQREKFLFETKRQVDYYRLAQEELTIAESTESLIGRPDDAFEELTARHFPYLFMDSYEEAPAPGRKFTEEEFGEFLFSYGNRTYLYRIFPEGNVRKFSVGVYRIVLDAFNNSRPVKDGLNDMVAIFRAQYPHVLSIFSQYLEEELGIKFQSEEEVFQAVRTLLLNKIKEFAIEGMLHVSC
ncbi:lanthionine synthetase LanC family protein [Roseivirga sp. BDSF3-8]|uniref:lanthionine synthetase LanC family protein n=1 Tax=Roseivirga sp. BDSF3-8 TaxID=3241598 RepID=UPI003531D077